MPQTDRARSTAPTILAAAAAWAAVGIAALARAGAGLCDRRIFVHHHHAGMTMPAEAPAGGGVCPILVYAALVAAALCVLALGVLAAARVRPGSGAAAAAKLVVDLRLGRLTALLGLAGAVPVAAVLLSEDGLRLSGLAACAAFALLGGGALLAALALLGAARAVLALARRLVGTLVAAFRLLLPGADAPWTPRREPAAVAAGAHVARRRPSRAPPIRV